MDVSQIASTINGLFDSSKSPAPQIPGLLMAFGGKLSPGMSVIDSTANVAAVLNEHGIPTDPLPDGSENKTLVVVKAIIEEVFKALRNDANLQVTFAPGAISVMTAGSNSAGPVISQGININFGQGTAKIQ